MLHAGCGYESSSQCRKKFVIFFGDASYFDSPNDAPKKAFYCLSLHLSFKHLINYSLKVSKSALIINIYYCRSKMLHKLRRHGQFFLICKGCHMSNYSLFGSVMWVRGSNSQSSCSQCSFSFDRSQSKHKKYKEDIIERRETYQLW